MYKRQIVERVHEALGAVNMRGFEKRAPHMLSGGQKQRIAIAGVLAMYPDVIVFDLSLIHIFKKVWHVLLASTCPGTNALRSASPIRCV